MSTFKPTWTPAKDFVHEGTGVCVRVNQTNHQIPQHSYEIGRYRDQDDPKSFIPFLLVRVNRDDVTSGKLDSSHLDAVYDMIELAEEWSEQVISAAADKFREKREKQENDEQAPEYVVQRVSRESRGNRRRQSVPTVSAPPSEPAPASVAA